MTHRRTQPKTRTIQAVDIKSQYIKLTNVVLLTLGLLVMAFYVFKTNQAVALRYKITVAKPILVREEITTQGLLADEESYINKLKESAANRGMVIVERFNSFFRESGVALEQGR